MKPYLRGEPGSAGIVTARRASRRRQRPRFAAFPPQLDPAADEILKQVDTAGL